MVFNKIGNRIVEFAAKVSMILGMVLVSILALFTVAYVLMRSFGVMTFGFYEIILLLIVALVLSGAAYTEKTDGHIRLDFIASRFSAKTQGLLRSLGLLFGLAFSTIFIWRLVIYTYSLFVKGTFYKGMVNLPYWPAYVVMCLAVICFVIILIAHLTKSIRENIACFRQPVQ